MKKKTVCLVSEAFPPIIDGVANVVKNYAEQIENTWGHAIVVTPAYPGADDTVYPFQVVRFASLDTRKMTTGYMAGIPFSPEVSNQLGQQQVDILHAHSPMMAALLSRALRKQVDAPMVMTYHTKYDIDIANVIKGKALQASSIKSIVTNISAFDEVWTVSKGAGENLKSLGYQGDYIVMPNGVDLEKGKASEKQITKETAGYDLPSGIPLFLYVGRLMWYKGFHITLDALKMLKEDGVDFRMVIVGKGGDADEIERYSNSLGLEKNVFFVGAISDRERIRCWYTRADLFLFPSTFDANGLVVREAAACGLASVLIADSCAAEDVTDGENAFLIEENAQSMAAVLKKILPDAEHIRQVGERAGEDLYLSWENAVANARERYSIVRDLYRCGAYEERRRLSDNLLATQGDLMETIGKIGMKILESKEKVQEIKHISGKNSKRTTKIIKKIY